MGGERRLTTGEIELVRSVFGSALDTSTVTLKRRKWFPLQPAGIVMAPCGHVHFHPKSPWYYEDFGAAPVGYQGLFIHEMTHVWQTQVHGNWYLPLRRHVFCSYNYALKPGWKLDRYGIEQQAEIVRHAFLLRQGKNVEGVGDAAAYDLLVDFPGAAKRPQPACRQTEA